MKHERIGLLSSAALLHVVQGADNCGVCHQIARTLTCKQRGPLKPLSCSNWDLQVPASPKHPSCSTPGYDYAARPEDLSQSPKARNASEGPCVPRHAGCGSVISGFRFVLSILSLSLSLCAGSSTYLSVYRSVHPFYFLTSIYILCTFVHMHVHMSMCTCIHIYIYTHV